MLFPYEEFGTEKFDRLMAEYCPDIPKHVGWFGGVTYGKSYWNSFDRMCLAETLAVRMLERINILSAIQEKEQKDERN